MPHLFKHNYRGTNYYFIWDVESGSLHNADYPAFLCAKKNYGFELSDCEERDYLSLGAGAVNEINQEFSALEKEGSLNRPDTSVFTGKNPYTIKSMCFNVCHDCNMRCAYCFAGGGSYNSRKSMMTADVGMKAVDFLIKNSGNRKNLEIDFFGGEPLLNLEVIKQLVEYAKAEGERNGKSFSFTVTTNCLLLDAETAAYLNSVMDNIVLSIDGRKCTHDRVRHPLCKDDTYEKAVENALRLKMLRNGKTYYVRGTFTSENLDFSEDIIALNNMGFDKISVEPVVLDENAKIAIRKEHLDKIIAEYEKFAGIYIDRRRGEKKFDFFHFTVDLETGPCAHKRMTGCGAGTEYLSVTPEGDIYPCHQFVVEKEFLLGNVYEGITRQDIRNAAAADSLKAHKECVSCFAKYYCGGGCRANAYKYGKNGLYETGCALTKKRFELSLAVAGIEKLYEQ